MNVQIDEVQNDLRSYLHRLEAGETLTLCDGDRPVAELKSVEVREKGKQRRPIGLAKGEFTVPDDFNDPLPEDLLRLFEGR
jgi:antitoxin (DNA-binding transcriptional repressor) of toxin-antitoxin stability system